MNKLKRFNILIAFLIGIADIPFVIKFLNENSTRLATALVLYGLLIVPFILERFFRHKKIPISQSLITTYLLFVFIAQYLGSVINLYKQIEWFDTFTHTLSGVLTGYLGILIFRKMVNQSEKKGNAILFSISFAALIALLWEIYEFTQDQITGSNLQHVLETGVTDTMTDMIVALIGSSLYCLYYWFKKQK